MPKFLPLRCPFDNCSCNKRIIVAPLNLLKNHVYSDHDYAEKIILATKFGIIKNFSEKRSSEWLAKQLSLKGIQ